MVLVEPQPEIEAVRSGVGTLRITDDPRCPWAINFGGPLHTRCKLDTNHPTQIHIGRGLVQFPYQNIEWMPGDRREYKTDRTDKYAWEQP